jgi:hypothetical protein
LNRRLEFNETVFVSEKEVRHGYMGGGGHVFFAKYTFNLPYVYPIFPRKKILFSYIIVVKSGLTLKVTRLSTNVSLMILKKYCSRTTACGFTRLDKCSSWSTAFQFSRLARYDPLLTP